MYCKVSRLRQHLGLSQKQRTTWPNFLQVCIAAARFSVPTLVKYTVLALDPWFPDKHNP